MFNQGSYFFILFQLTFFYPFPILNLLIKFRIRINCKHICSNFDRVKLIAYFRRCFCTNLASPCT